MLKSVVPLGNVALVSLISTPPETGSKRVEEKFSFPNIYPKKPSSLQTGTFPTHSQHFRPVSQSLLKQDSLLCRMLPSPKVSAVKQTWQSLPSTVILLDIYKYISIYF